MGELSEPLAVLAFSMPEECFPEGDEACITAGLHIARELGAHLQSHGHVIPEWVQGGCREDCWVYLASEIGGTPYRYDILFFPRSDNSIAVRYGRRVGFWHRVFRGRPDLDTDDPIHEIMRAFGEQYENAELMTEKQFDSQY